MLKLHGRDGCGTEASTVVPGYDGADSDAAREHGAAAMVGCWNVDGSLLSTSDVLLLLVPRLGQILGQRLHT